MLPLQSLIVLGSKADQETYVQKRKSPPPHPFRHTLSPLGVNDLEQRANINCTLIRHKHPIRKLVYLQSAGDDETKKMYDVWEEWFCLEFQVGVTLNAYESVDSLWASTFAGCRTNTGCQEHVIAILQEVDIIGDAEALLPSVTNLEGAYSDQLKTDCAQLVSRAQLWVVAEEQIVALMDQGQEVLDQALFEDKLVWQCS
ncbi:hypothetical protein P692DRAFT_20880632 [Suillus brevipes Sb2]|nr:hypothetical protein P692DRAFT_20880632 [Suillus brevipes Sb2]